MERFSTDCESILLVEDDEDIRDALSMWLRFDGYTVYEAGDGQHGLEKLSALSAPCLVILDWNLPVLSGAKFLEKVIADPQWSQNPVVVFTAQPEFGAKPGSAGLLGKPADLDQISEMVRKFMRPTESFSDLPQSGGSNPSPELQLSGLSKSIE